MTPQDDHQHDDSNPQACPKSQCGCCGPVEFEFPEDLMTPELKKLQDSMSKEEFEALMKALM